MIDQDQLDSWYEEKPKPTDEELDQAFYDSRDYQDLIASQGQY